MDTIRKLIIRLAHWLIWLALPKVVLDGAKFCVSKIDPTPHIGGVKRILVYAKLLKQYPDVPKRWLSLAIEIAIAKKG